MNKILIKKVIFVIIISILILPFIQSSFYLIHENDLKGDFYLTEKPDSIKQKWFTEEFQKQYDKYFNDHIGFRNSLIRLNNQIKYSIFDYTTAYNTIKGKDGVWYQSYYIDAYLGMDYLGEKKILSDVNKLILIQKELLKLNKKFLYIIAPGKASIYPEYFPDKYEKIKKDTSNYDTYKRLFNKYGISYLDLRNFLLQVRDTSIYPLFPKNGTHWSGYSVALVADTLFKHIGRLLDKNITNIEISKGKMEIDNLQFTDNDIGKALNLIFDVEKWPLYYPEVKFNSQNKERVKGLIIGDSFAQSFFGFDSYFYYLFTQSSRYIYYYKTIFWPAIKDEKLREMKNLDLSEQISDKEIIIILSTEQNLKKNGFGFVDDLYDLIKSNRLNTTTINRSEIEFEINRIKANKEWYKGVIKQAKERNISVDSMLIRTALYIQEQRKINN